MTKIDIKKLLYFGGFALIIAASLGYVFWGADLIPDTLAGIPPTTLLGWVDDAVALIAMVLALRRWKLFMFPAGKKGKPIVTLKSSLIFIPIIVLVLGYIFWGVDLIPDASPLIGWVDDVVAVLFGMLVAARLRQLFFPRKKR